jgi:uncharacterized protein HemX
MGLDPATWAIIAAASSATAAGYSIYSGEQQQKKQEQGLAMQEQANKQALATAQKQEKSAEENVRAANRKQADVSAILAAAQDTGGGDRTLLTGPMGVDPNQLALGRNTLLGA